jgi:pimeloyl-[acyl-carrier protein] synthase
MTISNNLDFDMSNMHMIGAGLIPHLAAIREADPCFWSEFQKGWFITRFADVAEGFGGKLPLSNVRLGKVAFAAIPESEWAARIPLLTTGTPAFANMTDPPVHARLRKSMNEAFKKSNVEAMRAFVKSRLHDLLDKAEAQGEFEFIETIARPLTGSVIMKLMGVHERHLDSLRDWANSIVSALGTLNPSAGLLEDGERAMREMDAVFTQALEQRKSEAQDDFLTTLAAAGQGEQGLSHAELLGTCVNTLLAGHESTASTMAMGVAALAQHPAQIRYMLEHPEREAQVVDELSRFVAMSASQTRLASQDFVWHGKQIRRGDVIFLWVASANRDPRVFDHSDELDLARNIKETLVFGRGIHHCVGHFLAKLQLGVSFPAIFARFNVELLDDPLDFSGAYSFRTLNTLNIRISAAA